eukprot:3165630-Prymnesium_polylepis.1
MLTKSLEVAAFDSHRMTLSGASAAVAASATSVNGSVAMAAVMDPLSVWESYFASASERVPD